MQLTGEIGTGKTMMLDALVLGLDARTKVARLSHTTISTDELFGLIFSEFDLAPIEGGRLSQIQEIQRFLDEWTAAGRNAVLVVDEAQNLSLPVLEEIRLLSNLRSKGLCSLQIVLAGQPEFRDKLDLPELRQLKQRIGIRYHLMPLSANETEEYVAHRLKVAGASGSPIFDRGALEAIYVHAQGVPRMINIVCDRALVAGYGANKRRIGRALIEETMLDIEGVVPEAQIPARGSSSKGESSKVAGQLPRALEPELPPEPVREPPVHAAAEQVHEQRLAPPELPPEPSTEPAPEQRLAAEQEKAHEVHRQPAPVVEFKAVDFERAPAGGVDGAPGADNRPSSRTRRQRKVRRTAHRAVRTESVTGASVDVGRMPPWVVPTVLGIAAVVIVVFSALQSGWWRAVTGMADSGPVAAVHRPAVEDARSPQDVAAEDPSDPAPAGAEADVVDDGSSEGGESAANAGSVDEVDEAPAAGVNTEARSAEADGAPGGAAHGVVTGARSEARPGTADGGAAQSDHEAVAVESPRAAGAATETSPLGGQIPPDPIRTPARPTIEGPGGPYRVVALSSRRGQAADDVVNELAGLDYVAEVVPVDIGDSDLWYRVLIAGGYPSLEEARGVVSELRSLGYIRAWVLKE